MNTVRDFARFKVEGRRISNGDRVGRLVRQIIAGSNMDAILVVDSVAMVIHGQPTMLARQRRSWPSHPGGRCAVDEFLIVDLPFPSFRDTGCDEGGALVTSGALAVKLEGVNGHDYSSSTSSPVGSSAGGLGLPAHRLRLDALETVECATLDWSTASTCGPRSTIGYVPPADYEAP